MDTLFGALSYPCYPWSISNLALNPTTLKDLGGATRLPPVPPALSRLQWLQARPHQGTEQPRDLFTPTAGAPRLDGRDELAAPLEQKSYLPMQPGQVGLPYAQPMEQGHVEFNQLPHLLAGLRAKGDQPTATAVLENWLSLGERYGCLPGSNEFHELGRAGMPRLSPLLLEEMKINPDPDLPARAYKVLADDHKLSWSDHYFKLTPNGLNRFCDVDYSHDASLVESGGECNRCRFQGDPAQYNPVDLNAHLWRTETDLASLAQGLGKKEEAGQWQARAAQRKATMLEQMWDSQEQRFYDLKGGQRSECPSLAQFALLSSGLLDPVQDADKVAALGADLKNFLQPDRILPVWDLQSKQEASPSQVLDVVDGLKKYGFQEQSEQLQRALTLRLATQSYQGLEDAAARERLQPQAGQRPFQPVFSPEGQARLQQLQPGRVLAPQQVGPLDRRLRQLHPSLLQPEVVTSLQQQGLSEAVYRLSGPISPGQSEQRQSLSLGNLECQFSSLQVEKLSEGGYRLSNGQDSLVLAQAGEQLVIGDRAYDLKELPNAQKLRLPQDLFQNFYLAGQNPALETFFDHDRRWLGEIEKGPTSTLGSLAGKPSWNQLFDFTEQSWPALTVDPSVVAGGSAMPIFNRAAVPSLGIFKTQFNWDTLFMARGMQLQGQGPVVAGMADNLLSLLQENGRVPNAARSVYLNKSQPPILPGLVRMSARIRPNSEVWLSKAYDLMSKDYQQFWNQPGQRGVAQIDDQATVLSRWGGPNHKFAMDESGFDTTSRFDGKTLDLIPPDLNAFLFRYAKDMQAMAEQLGKPGEAADWAAQAQARKDSLIQFCWDDQDGMFRDYRFQGEAQGLQRQEDVLAAVATPLWAGMLDPKIPGEKVMLERSLKALDRFEKAHGLAATAEDYGHPEMQWNGPSGWAPLHLMAIEAAVQGGKYADAARWTEKWLDTIADYKAEKGAVLERYDMVEGGAPPVQKGRYEETQGEGPGFGWTNATVPWALVEVVGGARVDNDKLQVEPVIPESLQGQAVGVNFADPGGLGSCQMRHRYDGASFETRLQPQGQWQGLSLTTPPLPLGARPQGLPQGANLRVLVEDGKVRYRVELTELPEELCLRFR